MDKKGGINKYTPQGRLEIHKNFADTNMEVLYHLTFRQPRQTNLFAAVRRNTAQESMTVSKFRTANGIGGAVGSAVRRRWIIS